METKRIVKKTTPAKKRAKNKDDFRSIHDSPLFTGGGFYRVKKK